MFKHNNRGWKSLDIDPLKQDHDGYQKILNFVPI